MQRRDIRFFEEEKVLGVMQFKRFRLSERFILVLCPCQGELPDVRLTTSRSFGSIKKGETHLITLPGGGASLGRGQMGKLVLDQTVEFARRIEVLNIALCAHSPCLFARDRDLFRVLWRLREAVGRLLRANSHFEISPCLTANRPLQGVFTHWLDLKALEACRAKHMPSAA